MIKTILILTVSFFYMASCGTGTSSQFNYQIPEKVDDGFDVGHLDEVSIDSGKIGSAIDDIKNGEYGEIHSLLIYRNGQLVLEEYFPGHDYKWDGPYFLGDWVEWNRDIRHNIHSVGKSITSACVGIAVDLGYIESVEQSIFEYLPEYQQFKTDGKDQITIEHLLTMTAGLEWDEWSTSYSSGENDIISLWLECDDPIACILQKPLISEPGTDFTYSSGNMILLGEIILNATGMDIESFSWKYLFDPMGIDQPEWRRFEDSGVVFASGDQLLTPREMLKFGVTYLNDGVWDGRQIIPEEWVQKSATPYDGPDNSWFNHFLRPIPPGDNTWGRRGYSYTWWTHIFSNSGQKIPAFYAYGWGGQKIIIFPNQNAVVVFTGANYTSADMTAKILKDYVIPSLE